MIKQIVADPGLLNSSLETWFLQNALFDGAPYSVGHGNKAISDSTVVFVALVDISLASIERIKSTGNKLVLYHMGDELAQVDISAYAACDLVVRNYFFPGIFDNPQYGAKLLWAPNGFRSGVGPRDRRKIKSADQRQFLSAFLGWLETPDAHGNERAMFAKQIAACGADLFCHSSTAFGGGYNVGLYAAIMEDSVFAPCPAGHSPETIRLYDALEVGCIPISLPHAFLAAEKALAALGPVPFPLIESWEQLPEFLRGMQARWVNDPAEIVALQARCIAWWKDYKSLVQEQIAARCNVLDSAKGNISLRSLAQRLFR